MRPKHAHTLRTTGIVLLAVFGGLLVAALLMDWLVVDVRSRETGGPHHVWIPIPVAALRMAAVLTPSDAFPDEPLPPELREQLPAIRQALNTLAAEPDTGLVTVETDEASVRVGIRSGALTLDVRAPDATVQGVIPIRRLSRALARLDDREDWRALIASGLSVLDDGFELSVDAQNATVQIQVR